MRPALRSPFAGATALPLLLLLLAACGGNSDGATARYPGPGTLSVTVSLGSVADRSGVQLAVAGATPASAVTGATGQQQFTKLAAGSYTVTASLPWTAERTLSAAATVNGGQTTPLAFSFTPVGDVTGQVSLQGISQPSGVVVAVAGTQVAATTDATGSYRLSGVPAGAQTLVASAPGFASASVPVTVAYAQSVAAPALSLAPGATPALDLSKLQIVRTPIGQPDSVSGAAGAVLGMLGSDPLSRPVKVNLRSPAGTLLATAVPAADGSLPATALPGDGTGGHFAPGEVLASVVDQLGLESTPASIPAGRDVAGPAGNGALVGFARRDTTQADGIAGLTGAFSDGTSALASVRLYLPDGTFVTSAPAEAGGGFAEIAVGQPGGGSPARLLVSAVDKCGNEGAPVEAGVGEELAGPALDGSRIAIARRPLGAQDGVSGTAGAIQFVCYPTAVTVSSDPSLPVAAGLVAQGAPGAADGSFLELPVGTSTRSYPRLWVSATDKCGLSSTVAAEAQNADVTPPVVDPTLIAYALQSGSSATVHGLAKAVTDLLSAVREVDLLPPSGGAALASVAPATDGSFPDQAVGAVAGDRVQVVATDKPGNVAAAVLSRKVSATLSLAGRVRQAPLAPLGAAAYAFTAPFDPRSAGPGLGPVLGQELSLADIGKASVLDGTTTASPAAAPWTAAGAGWALASGGARSYASGAVDSADQALLVFGGWDGVQTLDETLEFVPLLGTWTRLSPVGGVKPSARTQAAMADLGNGTVLLFGGADATGTPLGDTWLWTGATATWTQLAPASAPGARYDAAIAFDAARNKVVLFGGSQLAGTPPYTSYAPLGDTWEYDVASGVWTQAAAVAPNAPSARSGAAMTWVQAPSGTTAPATVLFGGADASGTSQADLWTWDGAAWTLSTPAQCAASPSSCPSARYDARLAFDPSTVTAVLQGGEPSALGDETWLLDPVARTWTAGPALPGAPRSGHVLASFPTTAPGLPGLLLTGGSVLDGLGVSSFASGIWNGAYGPGALPSARSRAPFAFDANLSSLLVHGNGSDPAPAASDTWTFGGAWSPGPASSPVLARAALAWDGARGVAVLYGCGAGASAPCGTWEWDGTTFQQRPSAHFPSARGGHSLAWDAAHGVTVLFGGADANGNPLAETWTWDGNDWTQLQTAAAPPARWYGGLAFDAARGVTVLSGGMPGAALAPLQDTWELSAAGWTQRTPAASPPASGSPALAYDPVRARVVLADDAGKVWEWDGASWTAPLLPGAGGPAPGARTAAALAWNPAAGVLALLGGSTSTTPGDLPAGLDVGDLWQLDRRAPAAVFAAQVTAFAVDPQATLTSAVATYAGAARGDELGSPSYDVEALAWDWVHAQWTTLGTTRSTEAQTAGNAITAPLPGALANYLQQGRLALLVAPIYPSSAPGGAGIASDLWTDYVALQVEYLLP